MVRLTDMHMEALALWGFGYEPMELLPMIPMVYGAMGYGLWAMEPVQCSNVAWNTWELTT